MLNNFRKLQHAFYGYIQAEDIITKSFHYFLLNITFVLKVDINNIENSVRFMEDLSDRYDCKYFSYSHCIFLNSVILFPEDRLS